MIFRKSLCLIVALALSTGGCERDERYPNRPLTLVCPWSPGGGTDQVSRQMAFFLEAELGVPCTVINATGGQGVTGHRRGMTARADGYTIAVITFELNTLHHQNLTTLTYQDMTPLISVNEDAAAIWVPADSPWNSLDDLVDDIQSSSKKMTASGTATGGAWHLAFAGWLQAAGLDIDAVKWIPKGGADPSIQELMSGGIDLVCCSLPEAKLYYDRGELRALGVMSEETVRGFEEIRTMREQNYDWVLVGWRGLAVPTGTPAARVNLLREAITKIVTGEVSVDGKTFPGFMEQRGFNNHWRNSEDFHDFLARNDRSLGLLLNSKSFASLGTGVVGPYLFPSLLGALLAGLFVVQLVTATRPEKLGVDLAKAISLPLEETKTKETTRTASIVNVACGLTFVAMYLLFAEKVGFVILSGILICLFLNKLGTRLHLSLLITLLIVPLTYQLFAVALRVPLPRGWWGW